MRQFEELKRSFILIEVAQIAQRASLVIVETQRLARREALGQRAGGAQLFAQFAAQAAHELGRLVGGDSASNSKNNVHGVKLSLLSAGIATESCHPGPREVGCATCADLEYSSINGGPLEIRQPL